VSRGERKFDLALREFLDEFYSHPERRPAALAEEPRLIGDVPDAYLAATAEYLGAIYKIPVPRWVLGHGRPLQKAFFAGGLESLKASLIVESPAAFRRRLLFVSKNALDRPRRPRDEPERNEPAIAVLAD
jgi:hypothetical protein